MTQTPRLRRRIYNKKSSKFDQYTENSYRSKCSKYDE